MGWLSAKIDILLKQLTILIHGEVPQSFLNDVVHQILIAMVSLQ